jgi:hypothetical protein
MKSKKSTQKNLAISIKLLLTILFLSVIVLMMSYRIFEINFIKNVNQSYKQIKAEEFELITESDKINVKYFDKLDGFFSEEQTTTQEEYISLLKILRGRTQLYLNLIREHRNEIQVFKDKTKYLVGERKTKVVQFFDTLLEYYNLEIESAESSLAYSDLLTNSYKLIDDETIFYDFIDKYNWDQTEISNNFSDLVALKKYANNDYEFSNIELIKKHNPKGYRSLENRAEFLGSYYEALSDYSRGNDTSANYKFEALNQKSSELEVDYDQIADEIASVDLDRSKKIAQLNVNELEMTQLFSKENLFDYSFMGNFSSGWAFEQTFCNLFAYKSMIYSDIKSEDLDFSTIDELNSALVEIPPSFNLIQDSINLSKINYSNNEDTVVFKCDGINSGTEYIFTTFKTEE